MHKSIVKIVFITALLVFSNNVLSATTPYSEYKEKINGTKLYFAVRTVDPNKPYILFLNGGPGGVSAYARGIFDLYNIQTNTIFLDQRGCGKSDRPVDPKSFSFDNLTKDIDGVLDKLKIQKVILLGHSFGGEYGFEYALRRPKRVMALIMVDPFLNIPQVVQNFYQTAYSYLRTQLKIANKAKKDELNSELSLLQKSETKDAQAVFDNSGLKEKFGFYNYKLATNKAIYKKLLAYVGTMYSNKELEPSELMQKSITPQNPNRLSYLANKDIEQNFAPDLYYLYGNHDVMFKNTTIIRSVATKFGKQNVVNFKNSGHSPMTDEPVKFKKVIETIYSKYIKLDINCNVKEESSSVRSTLFNDLIHRFNKDGDVTMNTVFYPLLGQKQIIVDIVLTNKGDDAYIRELKGKKVIFFNLDMWTTDQISKAGLAVVKHEVTHILLNRLIPEPNIKDNTAILNWLIINEGVAQFIGYPYDRTKLFIEHSKEWAKAEKKLKAAQRELSDPNTPTNRVEQLLKEANSGLYWNKYASIAGMFRIAKIYKTKGVKGIQDCITTGLVIN